MRSINLAFDLDYLLDKKNEQLSNQLTKNYQFICDNYAVGYQLLSILDKIPFCEHSMLTDDCSYPYSWIIFITCRPEDIDRIECIAKRIPSSIIPNIRIHEEGDV